MVSPYASTERDGRLPPPLPPPLPDCEAGRTALRYLNGDGPKQPGVFSRLDRIERLLGLGVLLIAGPLWWMAWMTYERAGQ